MKITKTTNKITKELFSLPVQTLDDSTKALQKFDEQKLSADKKKELLKKMDETTSQTLLANIVANIGPREFDCEKLQQFLLSLIELLKKYLTCEEIASLMLQESNGKFSKNDSFMKMIILKGFWQIYDNCQGVIEQVTFSQDFLARVLLQSTTRSLKKVLESIDLAQVNITEALKSVLKDSKTTRAEEKILYENIKYLMGERGPLNFNTIRSGTNKIYTGNWDELLCALIESALEGFDSPRVHTILWLLRKAQTCCIEYKKSILLEWFVTLVGWRSIRSENHTADTVHESMEVLLDLGLKDTSWAEYKSDKGESLLHLALVSGKSDQVIRFLLKRGVPLHSINQEGQSAIGKLGVYGWSKRGDILNFIASKYSQSNILEMLEPDERERVSADFVKTMVEYMNIEDFSLTNFKKFCGLNLCMLKSTAVQVTLLISAIECQKNELVIFLLGEIETEKVDVEERKKILVALCKMDNINLFELCENKGLVKSTQIQEIKEYSPLNLLFYGYKKGDKIFAENSKNTTYLLNCIRKATDDKHHEFIETVITNVRGFTKLTKAQSLAWMTALKKALKEKGAAFIRLVCDRVDVRALSQNQSLLKYAFQNNQAVCQVDTDTIKLILEAHASTYTEDEIKELLQLILEKNHIGITEDNWYRTAGYLMRQISINNTLTLNPETLPNQKFRDLYSSWQKQVEIAKQIVETNESFMLYSKSKDEIIDAWHVWKQKVLLIMLNVWDSLEQEYKIILSNIQALFQQYNQGSLVADKVKRIISDFTNQHINSLQTIFDGQRYLIPMMDLWEMKSIREAVMQHQSACQAYNQSGRYPKIKDQGIEICINNDFCRGLLNKFNQKNPFTAYYVHLETSIAHSMRQIESIITHAIWPGSDPMGNGVTSLIMSFIRWDRYQLEDCHGPLAVIAALFDKEKGLGGADDTLGYLLAQSGNKVRAHCILDPNTIRQVTAALATDSKRARQEEPSSSSSSSSLVTGNKRARQEEPSSSSSSSSSCSSKRPIVDGR